MIALLSACTHLPALGDVDGEAPPDWIRVASTDGHWQASFPTWPTVSERPQTVQFGDEPAQSVVIRWTQSMPSWGSYAVGSAPQTPAVLASTGPRMIAIGAARHAANEMGARLGPTVPWEGVQGGVRGRVEVDEPYSAVAAGVVEGVLVVAHATSREDGSVEAFLDGVRAQAALTPVELAVGEGIRVRCPAYCGPARDTVTIAGVAAEITGVQGVVDDDRFEMVVAPLRPGVDPLTAQEELRARFVQRVEGRLTDVRPDDLEGQAAVRARYSSGLAIGEIRTGVVGEEVVAAEVWAGSGGLPAWSEGFLGSIAAR